MKNTIPIPNPRELAGKIAQIILENSYNAYNQKVHDVLLFGSARMHTSRNVHDLDLLLIHTLDSLEEYEIITKYNESVGRPEFDPETKIEEKSPCTPEGILDLLGSTHFPEHSEYEHSLITLFREQLPQLRKERDLYQGTVVLEEDLEITIESPLTLRGALYFACDKISDKVNQDTVLGKVGKLLDKQDLLISPTLDLHVMNLHTLNGENETRLQQTIQQCQDPTFWYTVLTGGLLYNQETGKFDTLVEQKYPGATSLFI